MATSEAAPLGASIPRPEHPNPQRYRPDWASLNGVWEFATDQRQEGLEYRWQDGKPLPKRIVVPFAYEWPLSGIGDRAIEEVLWYARDFEVPEEWLTPGRDLLLHFGAVDYRCRVWVNGVEAGHNRGGHVPFAFEIASLCQPGENRLVVRVEDSLDPHQPRGKQATNGVSRTCDYHGTTGIWQTVWLESVSSVRIEDFVLTPRLGETDALDVHVLLARPVPGLQVEIQALSEGAEMARAAAVARHGVVDLRLEIPNARRWSPDDPFLYDLRLRLFAEGRDVDMIESYAGLREIEIQGDRFLLNGQEVYLRLVLDQGYWPEGGMTAPHDEALRADVELCLALGFNGARKHQKVEDPRWLYWCDRLGLLVWGEMANARAWSLEAEEAFLGEWERAVRRDVNHPCIVTWAPMNESWGIPHVGKGHRGQTHFVERTVALTRRLDGTRPVIDNDGWEHTGHGDIYSIHDYTADGDALRARYAETRDGGPMQSLGWGEQPVRYLAPGIEYRGEPVVLSEVGGLLDTPPDLPWEKLDRLYHMYGVSAEGSLAERYRDLMNAVADLPFVCGFCTTQLTDVEQEVNGLLTYDRQPKIPLEEAAAIHREMTERHYRERLRQPRPDRRE